ncbi:hypothetical protein [Aliamphritea spongicola]|nr:hypothetical protein [Aliamphritea spongicola]
MEKYENDITREMNNSSIAKVGIETKVEFPGMNLNRPIFQELSEGVFQFSDNTDKYDFGFTHSADSTVMSNAIDVILSEQNLSIDITSPMNRIYVVSVITGSLQEHQIKLKSGANSLDTLTEIN